MRRNYREGFTNVRCSQTILCLVIGRSVASPIANVWLSPVPGLSPLRQFHMQDGSGSYRYSFTGPHHAKAESTLDGVTQGGESAVSTEIGSFQLDCRGNDIINDVERVESERVSPSSRERSVHIRLGSESSSEFANESSSSSRRVARLSVPPPSLFFFIFTSILNFTEKVGVSGQFRRAD